MKKYSLIALLAAFSLTLSFASPTLAKTVDRVVATVNSDVITLHELEQRFNLSRRQLGRNLNEGQKKVLYSRTLGELIDETLRKAYAAQHKISVNDQEYKQAIRFLERSNGLPTGGFERMASGLEEAAKQQVTSEIIWQKIVDRHVRPRVIISNGEIDRLIENLIKQRQITEKEIEQFFLAENDQDEESIQKNMEALASSIKNSDNPVEAALEKAGDLHLDIAHNVMGWFGPGELSPMLDEALKDLKKGEMSKVVRSPAGWHILMVKNTREKEAFKTEPYTEYKLTRLQVNLPSSDEAAAEALEDTFNEARKNAKRLSQFEEEIAALREKEAFAQSGDMGWVKEADLPTHYLKAVKGLSNGSFSNVINQGTSLTLLYLTDTREKLPEELTSYRERIRSRLLENRVELTSRRFMRDLRRKAYIDIRL